MFLFTFASIVSDVHNYDKFKQKWFQRTNKFPKEQRL